MKKVSSGYILLVLSMLLLASCSTKNIIKNSEYLDDNYSDRWDLAKKLLGNDVVYFDTSNYGKIAEFDNTANIESENNRVVSLMQGGLVKVFADVNSKGGNVALSGISSKDTLTVLADAISSLDNRFAEK